MTLAAAMLVLQPAAALRAQSSGAVGVRVTSAETGLPVVGARLVFRYSVPLAAVTDSGGGALVFDVPFGVTGMLAVRHPAFFAESASVLADSVVARTIEIRLRRLPVHLDSVVTTAPHGSRVPGFDDRRRTGHGYFISREDIEREQPHATTDLLRHVPGIRLVPVSGGYHVRSTRASSARDCPLSAYINGMPVTNEISHGRGNSSPSVVDGIMPGTIEAMEIYGVSEVPPQYNHGDSSCGVILIWTRVLHDPDE